MTKIKDIKIYDLEECVIASGYAMRTESYNYLEESIDGKYLIILRGVLN